MSDFKILLCKEPSLTTATGMCQSKYQIWHILRLKQYLLHPGTMFDLLVLLFIVKLYARFNILKNANVFKQIFLIRKKILTEPFLHSAFLKFLEMS